MRRGMACRTVASDQREAVASQKEGRGWPYVDNFENSCLYFFFFLDRACYDTKMYKLYSCRNVNGIVRFELEVFLL